MAKTTRALPQTSGAALTEATGAAPPKITRKTASAKTAARPKTKAPAKSKAAPKSTPGNAAASKSARAKKAPSAKTAPAAKPTEAKTDTPRPTDGHSARPAGDKSASSLMLLSPEQQEALEALSRNLARAAVTAQGAFAEAALRSADRPAMSPDPFHVGPALSEVISGLAAQPDRLIRAQAELLGQYMNLWRASVQRMTGETAEAVVQPAKGDKRFADEDWSKNPVFDMMKQSYLLTSNWLNKLVADVEGVDPMANRRVEFFMRMLTDAFSPSNFLMSNPVALREIAATHGESLARGMENFAADLARGEGQLAISQTDSTPFEVGVNIASAPGKVVFQNEFIQLLQYSPATEQAHEIPLLIFPPWINKFYILDLRPENSMIRWLVSQGFSVFVTSWVNPDARLADKTFDDYMVGGVHAAVEAVKTQCGVDEVNTVGYCIGGTLLSCALAHAALKGDHSIRSATFFAAQQDFSDAGELQLFTDENWIADIEKQIDAGGGVLSSKVMADTFNALRANDLIWSYFVNNYLLGKEPKPFDLLYWNSDQTRMPKLLHLFYLREFYRDNKLAKGELVLGGERLDLGKVRVPVFIQSSREDHIAPYPSVYRGAKLFGGPVTFIMAGSGHIAGVINAPSANKYQHWVNDALPDAVEDWMADASERPGSWWPTWRNWLAQRSGPLIPARDPAKGPLKPLEDAPGSFVRVRS